MISVWKLIPDQQGELTLTLDMEDAEKLKVAAPDDQSAADEVFIFNGYFGEDKKI